MPSVRDPAPSVAGILVSRIVGVILIVGVLIMIVGMIATNDLDYTQPGVLASVIAGGGLLFVLVGGFGASLLRLPSPAGGVVALCILWIPGVALLLGGISLLIDWTNFSVQHVSRWHRWIVFTHGEVVGQGWGLIALGAALLTVWVVVLTFVVRARRSARGRSPQPQAPSSDRLRKL